MNEIFDEIENTILSFADDNNYKDSYALFNVGKIEKTVDYCRYLQHQLEEKGKENQQLKKQKDEVVEYIKYQLSNLDFKKDEDMKAKMLGSMIIVMLEDNGMLGEIDEL